MHDIYCRLLCPCFKYSLKHCNINENVERKKQNFTYVHCTTTVHIGKWQSHVRHSTDFFCKVDWWICIVNGWFRKVNGWSYSIQWSYSSVFILSLIAELILITIFTAWKNTFKMLIVFYKIIQGHKIVCQHKQQ